MNSNLNNAKELELRCTFFQKDGKKMEFPPLANSKYPTSIAERALREYIARGVDAAVIPLKEKIEKKPVEQDRGE